jgi:hypothetical protein
MTRERSGRNRSEARLTRVEAGRATAALAGGRRDAERSADAVVQVASAAAFAAGASAPGRPAGSAAPRLLSLSLDLFRHDPRGSLTADAALSYRGHRSLVVDVKVRDAEARLIAALVVTQLDPEPRAPARRAS